MVCYIVLFCLLGLTRSSQIWDKVFHAVDRRFAGSADENLQVIDDLDAFLALDTSDANNTATLFPYVLCGPIIENEKKEGELSEAFTGTYAVVILDEGEGQLCYLLHGSYHQVEMLKRYHICFLVYLFYFIFSDVWIAKKIPNSYKIHSSIFEAFTGTLEKKSNGLALYDSDDGGAIEGESLMLVIQYMRGGDVSAKQLSTRILEQWSRDPVLERHNIGQWSRMRNYYFRGHERECALPSDSNIENDAYATRIVDMTYLLKHKHCLYSMVSTISANNDVLSVSMQSRPVLLNYDAKGIVQSGVSGLNSFHDKGITGENQIVGIADSGLNDYSCFFYDNSLYYSDARTTRTGISSSSVERYRRKVIQYVSYADGTDVVGGHGTHVAGTIVGSSIFDGYSGGNGVAPDAKIAFYDVQNGNSPYLSIPDLNMYVLKTQYNAGARVMSHSWGSNTEGTTIYEPFTF